MDRNTILKIANLSKLVLTEDEIVLFQSQFQKILDYMAQLSEVNVDDVEAYMTPITGKLRKDDSADAEYIDKKTALEMSAHHDDNFFIVPKVSVK